MSEVGEPTLSQVTMETLNFIVKRIVLWPIVVVGMILVQTGGLLIRFGAWGTDLDVSDVV